jgi:DNA primase
LVASAGIELKKVEKDRIGRCPFHADEKASLVVTPQKNLWHCFGCGVGGGPIDWLMKKQGVSFRHAVELLKADSSLGAPSSVQASWRIAQSEDFFAKHTIDMVRIALKQTGMHQQLRTQSPETPLQAGSFRQWHATTRGQCSLPNQLITFIVAAIA